MDRSHAYAVDRDVDAGLVRDGDRMVGELIAWTQRAEAPDDPRSQPQVPVPVLALLGEDSTGDQQMQVLGYLGSSVDPPPSGGGGNGRLRSRARNGLSPPMGERPSHLAPGVGLIG
jgi:hypothetical protein